ncbi:hypothetical protein JOC86_002340 [Bacillus pakistanensis]|uniref:Ribosomal protein S21 n=1 Tax=Rossellomorea pakistanensis TaxID=992288 RepID=A0ABS2ND58_9BACI|nr:hypothetical protein [Bacillus pakistanensis]MBM7585798.1 hypothetical protein [Bacillus pakistanensis]
MFNNNKNDLFNKFAKKIIDQEHKNDQFYDKTRQNISSHKKQMMKRREAFSLIRNK